MSMVDTAVSLPEHLKIVLSNAVAGVESTGNSSICEYKIISRELREYYAWSGEREYVSQLSLIAVSLAYILGITTHRAENTGGFQ